MTLKQEHEIQLGFRRGNDALLAIARAKTPRDAWLAGACLHARARASVVLAALEADLFFSTWIPVWIERAEAARIAGNHARRSYYLCLANAGRDAQRDARDSARGGDLHKTIIWLDSSGRLQNNGRVLNTSASETGVVSQSAIPDNFPANAENMPSSGSLKRHALHKPNYLENDTAH